jgi:CBS domain-containing protein
METPLAEVLALLAANRISCVPIVEAGPGGRILDVWGREDVLFLATDPTLEALALPVRVTRAAQLAASRGVHSVRTCSPADSLRSVIDTFAATRVSRVVSVDPAGRPVGIITISDLFHFFAEAAQDAPEHDTSPSSTTAHQAATAIAPAPVATASLPPPQSSPQPATPFHGYPTNGHGMASPAIASSAQHEDEDDDVDM